MKNVETNISYQNHKALNGVRSLGRGTTAICTKCCYSLQQVKRQFPDMAANVPSVTPQSALRQSHAPFRSQFSTHYDLMLPVPITGPSLFLSII